MLSCEQSEQLSKDMVNVAMIAVRPIVGSHELNVEENFPNKAVKCQQPIRPIGQRN